VLEKVQKKVLWTLSFTAFIWLGSLLFFQNSDVEDFKKKIEEKREQKAPVLQATSQLRTNVVKDLFVVEDQGRVHHKIISSSSVLFLIPENRHFDVVEKLDDITCWMQEKLYSGAQLEQQVRFFKAEEGFYRYSSQQFIAQSVDLSLYRLPGSELPDQSPVKTPLLKGHAHDVSFTLAGKAPQFKASQFKAELAKGKNG
jgi:hypothetical protein